MQILDIIHLHGSIIDDVTYSNISRINFKEHMTTLNNNTRLNKSDVVAGIAEKTGFTKVDSERALDALIDIIKEALQQRREIRLLGFGSFYVSKRNATMARNPRTGEEIKVPETFIPKFRAGKQLKETTVNCVK